MSEKTVKLIRKQLRNVTQEMVGGILTKELGVTILETLQKNIDKRLDVIAKSVQTVMERLEQTQKDAQSLLLRQSTAQTELSKPQALAPSELLTPTEDKQSVS